jgi:hypothetical protein
MIDILQSAVERLKALQANATAGEWRPAECTPARPDRWCVGVGRIGDGLLSDAPDFFVTPWGMKKEDAELISMSNRMLPLIITILEKEIEEMEAEGRPPYDDIYRLAQEVNNR